MKRLLAIATFLAGGLFVEVSQPLQCNLLNGKTWWSRRREL